MPRSNRPRGRRGVPEDGAGQSLEHLSYGWRRTEQRRSSCWNVQPVSAAQSVKIYVCPGCELDITPGLAHLVTWRADGVLGDTADIAARRHWHTHCWRIS